MSNIIKLGSSEISAFKVGSNNVDAIYLGATKVYPSGEPTPPMEQIAN